MFKKIIPSKYQYEYKELVTIINNITIEKVPIRLDNNVLTIDYDFSSEQLQKLKSDFLNIAQVIEEI